MNKNIIIADLDGTIAIVDHRRHFVEGKHKDWTAFYEACDKDEPNQAVITILQSLREDGYIINIFSGRDDSMRRKTRKWLKENLVPFDSLLMRPKGDYTPDNQLKRQWLYKNDAKHFKDKVLVVFDDRQKVVDMWRAEGLSCFQVAPGDF